MRIWFDLSNSPHINLFHDLIRDLERQNTVIITSRPLANTIDLLRLKNLKFKVVGRHYGASKVMKAYGYPVRVLQLLHYLRDKSIDVAVSQSSFHSPIAAKLLGIPSIYMNDNEHALGNVPSFILATRVLVPEFLSVEKVRKQGAASCKIIQYPGVKEGIYLWNSSIAKSLGRNLSVLDGLPRIYIRPEPWTAQYYSGKCNFLDDMLAALKGFADIFILPRGADQGQHYRSNRFSHVRVIDTPLTLEDIAQDCDLFIGAGGTMTREMAVIGVPTISVYQDALLDVDRFLLDRGLMVHKPDADANFVMQFLNESQQRGPNRDLLERGRDAYMLILRQIEELGTLRRAR